MEEFEFEKEFINGYIDSIIEVLDRLRKEQMDALIRVIEIIRKAREEDKTVFIMGNGGSAATSSHFVSDLAKGTIVEGQGRFRAIALTDNIPLITAWSNDSDYSDIFLEQLKNLLRPGDVVIGISGSGNSKNVLKAVEYARENGAVTIGFVGYDGGKLKDMVDTYILADIHYMQKAEDIHMLLEHMLTSAIRERDMKKV